MIRCEPVIDKPSWSFDAVRGPPQRAVRGQSSKRVEIARSDSESGYLITTTGGTRSRSRQLGEYENLERMRIGCEEVVVEGTR